MLGTGDVKMNKTRLVTPGTHRVQFQNSGLPGASTECCGGVGGHMRISCSVFGTWRGL